jgi:GNAT superfamily N-acetyltransferase
MTATMRLFGQWGTRQTGLFTFPDSPKHIGLYGKFGFRPQTRTPVLSKHVGRTTAATPFSTFSEVPLPARVACLAACRSITEAVYPGLDAGAEIMATARQQLGDTLLIDDGREPVGFAICHSGKGSEAGTGAAFVKFAAVRPGLGAARAFDRLLSACEAFADARGLVQLIAGINTARRDAHRIMLRRDFRPFLEGIAMLRPDEPGYNRPDCFVIDDWR